MGGRHKECPPWKGIFWIVESGPSSLIDRTKSKLLGGADDTIESIAQAAAIKEAAKRTEVAHRAREDQKEREMALSLLRQVLSGEIFYKFKSQRDPAALWSDLAKQYGKE